MSGFLLMWVIFLANDTHKSAWLALLQWTAKYIGFPSRPEHLIPFEPFTYPRSLPVSRVRQIYKSKLGGSGSYHHSSLSASEFFYLFCRFTPHGKCRNHQPWFGFGLGFSETWHPMSSSTLQPWGEELGRLPFQDVVTSHWCVQGQVPREVVTSYRMVWESGVPPWNFCSESKIFSGGSRVCRAISFLGCASDVVPSEWVIAHMILN